MFLPWVDKNFIVEVPRLGCARSTTRKLGALRAYRKQWPRPQNSNESLFATDGLSPGRGWGVYFLCGEGFCPERMECVLHI